MKRENFMWDAAICYSIGGFHRIDGASIVLVTDDAAIRVAARAAKCEDRVVSTYGVSQGSWFWRNQGCANV